ncbi:MAG: hypothetical protein FJW37_13870, partial [Acidobacteria bacterium]|nr:hypothetical protein [Acidobacteriota bacterium]
AGATAVTPLPDSRPPSVAASGPDPAAMATLIAHAVNPEMAQRLADVLLVSTTLGFERRWTREQLEPLAEEMGRRLDWPAARCGHEVELVLRLSSP